MGLAASLNNLGNLAADQGDYRGSRALHEESLAIRRELGDRGASPPRWRTWEMWHTNRAILPQPMRCTWRA